jgi:hypothetical protein
VVGRLSVQLRLFHCSQPSSKVGRMDRCRIGQYFLCTSSGQPSPPNEPAPPPPPPSTSKAPAFRSSGWTQMDHLTDVKTIVDTESPSVNTQPTRAWTTRWITRRLPASTSFNATASTSRRYATSLANERSSACRGCNPVLENPFRAFAQSKRVWTPRCSI